MAQLKAVSISNAGKARDINEDCFLSGGYVPDNFTLEMAGSKNIEHTWATTTKQTVCLAVFDGMGDSPAGQSASRMAADALKAEIGRLILLPLSYLDALMQRYATRVNDRIRQMRENEPSWTGMGTTFACLCLRGDQAVIYNLGNCKAFLYRQKQLKQLTVDYMADATHYSARSLRYLGMQESGQTVNCETTNPFLLQDQDCFLLCSSGLVESIDIATIRSCLNHDDLLQAATELAGSALDRGGQNNVTVTVARWTETEQPYRVHVAEAADLNRLRPANPRIEHHRQEFRVPMEKPKIDPEKLKISPINFWQSVPYWLQILSLIGLLGILLLIFWLLGPRLFG